LFVYRRELAAGLNALLLVTGSCENQHTGVLVSFVGRMVKGELGLDASFGLAAGLDERFACTTFVNDTHLCVVDSMMKINRMFRY
jgi:hypothetical protein